MNSKPFSVIVCDLDGTLLTDTKKLTDENIQTLIKAQEQGYTLVLATGRGNAIVDHFVERLRMKEFNGYVITFNGQQVIELKTGKVHHDLMIETDSLFKVFDFAKRNRLQLILEDYDKYLVYTPKSLVFMQLYIRYLRAKARRQGKRQAMHSLFNVELVSKFTQVLPLTSVSQITHAIPKMGFSQKPNVISKALVKAQAAFDGELSVMRVAPTWIDMAPLGVDKANGIQWVSERLNVPLSEFIAFGDSENDIDMLKMVGTSYAMKNAMPGAKAISHVITSHTNNENGVSIELEKLLKV